MAGILAAADYTARCSVLVMQILISGASVAGPALALLLAQAGHQVTVVEKAESVRGGGYPIDVRGAAVDVLDRMGVLPRVRAAHINTRRLSFVDQRGRVAGAIRPEVFSSGQDGRDLEVPRGHLTTVLHEAARDHAEFVFGDAIASLNSPDQRQVTFDSGIEREFDLVIGADGLHSHTRRLAFDGEYEHYLGYCFAGFTIPNDLGLAHESVTFNAPGRMASVYAPGCSDTLHGFLLTSRPEAPLAELRDVRAQRRLMSDVFAGDGWLVPRLLDGMRTANDVFFDVVSQVRMPAWSSGRVGLVGDAAYAPSFASGQGTSIALAGAYVLAAELTARGVAGLATYERRTRPYVLANQALAGTGGSFLAPGTARGIWLRNRMFRILPLIARTGFLSRSAALTLPEDNFRPYATSAP
jgi:2-polyprenyl-6-methoxyphenol hydroxylase-like FAD-dependent oxidoreductase